MFALADRERGVCLPSDERHTQETHGVHVVWCRRVRMSPVSSPAVYVISRAHLCSTRCCCCYCTEDTLLIHPTPSLTDHCMTSRHWDSTCCILMTSPGGRCPSPCTYTVMGVRSAQNSRGNQIDAQSAESELGVLGPPGGNSNCCMRWLIFSMHYASP